MNRRKGMPPTVEGMEPRAMLSGLAAGLAEVVSPSKQPAAPALNGTFQGTFSREEAPPDAGTPYRFSGSGRLGPRLGRATIAGSLRSAGFIASGHAGGTLTLTARRGTVTLSLTGPSQAGFSPLPGTFTFTATAGTGRFSRERGSGTATVTLLTPQADPIPGAGATIPVSGRFQLVLRSKTASS